MKQLLPFALVALIAGCGHSTINYRPSPPANMTLARAVSVVERGFYEDFGDQKAQAVQITDEAIIISDGSITTTRGIGTAVPIYGTAIVATNSVGKTVAAGQHIYLSALEPSIVVERNGRDNRFAVIIRTEPGITARRVFFRSQARATEFADAIEYLHRCKPD